MSKNREKLIAAGTNPDEQAFGGFTQLQLHDAFDLVCDPDGWKMPIKNKVIDGKDLAMVEAAVKFFTGGGLSKTTTTRDGRVKISAKGYYHHTGS